MSDSKTLFFISHKKWNQKQKHKDCRNGMTMWTWCRNTFSLYGCLELLTSSDWLTLPAWDSAIWLNYCDLMWVWLSEILNTSDQQCGCLRFLLKKYKSGIERKSPVLLTHTCSSGLIESWNSKTRSSFTTCGLSKASSFPVSQYGNPQELHSRHTSKTATGRILLRLMHSHTHTHIYTL